MISLILNIIKSVWLVLTVSAFSTAAFPPRRHGACFADDGRTPNLRWPTCWKNWTRRSNANAELAAEEVVIAYERGRGWERNVSGTRRLVSTFAGFGPADGQTGARDPVNGIRRVKVKGRNQANQFA